jgi:type VI secretion system secreted protein Hcp
MALPIYMWIKNEAGSPIQGSVKMNDERDGSIEINALDLGVVTPTDPHSGKINGMRKHLPLKITKEIDKSSAPLFQAVTMGKSLSQVLLRFYRHDVEGIEEEYYRIEYEGVKITSLQNAMPNIKDIHSDNVRHLEYIEMSYDKMTVTFVEGNLTHSDSWEERKGRVA